MSRPVQIRVRAARDILTDKVLVLRRTEGVAESIFPLSVQFDSGYFGPEGQPIREAPCCVPGLSMDDIEITGVIGLVEGDGS